MFKFLCSDELRKEVSLIIPEEELKQLNEDILRKLFYQIQISKNKNNEIFSNLIGIEGRHLLLQNQIANLAIKEDIITFFSIYIKLDSKINLNKKNKISLSKVRYVLYREQSRNSQAFSSNIIKINNGIFMTENIIKTDSELDIQFGLSLGSVEIKLSDLLKIKAGETICFERPEQFYGYVLLDNKVVAKTTIQITEDEILLSPLKDY